MQWSHHKVGFWSFWFISVQFKAATKRKWIADFLKILSKCPIKLYSLTDTSHLNTPYYLCTILSNYRKMSKKITLSQYSPTVPFCNLNHTWQSAKIPLDLFLYLNLHQKLMRSILGRDPASIQVSSNSVLYFYVILLTNKQTNKQTLA